MKKASVSSQNLGVFQSLGATSNRDENAGGQKSWSSERLLLPGKSSQRHLSAASLMPLNNRRALPSKWEDAERWICSPVSGQRIGQISHSQPQKRPKSKSGPIMPAGVVCYANYSPAMEGLEDGSTVRSFLVGPPLSDGVLVADDGLFARYGKGEVGQSHLADAKNSGVQIQSASLPGWSELLLSEPSLSGSQDEKLDGAKQTMDSCAVLRQDMATRVSHKGGINSSLRGVSSTPSFPSILETHGDSSTKVEVRNMQVDKPAKFISWSKGQIPNTTQKRSPRFKDFNNSMEAQASSWNISEEEIMSTSKLLREEAKITAWEKLQKEKAEAAIRKLEVKLEKKRSSSMDTILNKLSMAEMKAQKMRSALSNHEGYQIPKTSRKGVSLRKLVRMGSFKRCFTSGHAF
ncbi:hypothetical protein I3842_02G008800 [Carya illinoinensis]|uniref:Remorin C-terminal domain-containing protein n=1 Tax=Carya illinoinensis TaxID=32201 RepID=A0A922FQL9_CARIL|nr:hypothetical protein I3842_02G008800 [Carya illinoinensis]